MDKIKVALIDDHNILRQSLARAMSLEFDIEVIGDWKSAEDAFQEIKNMPCDVIVIDLKLPGINGIEATEQILAFNSKIKIIVLSAYTNETDVLKSIRAGVSGYLPKEVTVEELVEAVRSVYRGYAVLDPQVTRKVFQQFSNLNKFEIDEINLLPLEEKILTLAASGDSNKQIADRLNLNEGAIKFHLREIFKKLNAKDRAHAVAKAMKQGLI